MEAWQAHVEREERRYRDGLARLPDGADARKKRLVRVANAAAGAGLASLIAVAGTTRGRGFDWRRPGIARATRAPHRGAGDGRSGPSRCGC